MQIYLIKNIQVFNEGRIQAADVLIKNGRIEKIGPGISVTGMSITEINGEGKYLLPGAIDDQVHFREPGLTHKATIASESRGFCAVAGTRSRRRTRYWYTSIPSGLTRLLSSPVPVRQ